MEDMDLSLRAYLRGWKFVFLNDVEVRWVLLAGPSLMCTPAVRRGTMPVVHCAATSAMLKFCRPVACSASTRFHPPTLHSGTSSTGGLADPCSCGGAR